MKTCRETDPNDIDQMMFDDMDSLEDESTLRAYVDGRNAARDGRANTPPDYSNDLCLINWQLGYDDYTVQLTDEES